MPVAGSPSPDIAGRAELRACREEIDRIDDAILAALDLRARAVLRLAAIKREHGIAVVDKSREQQVMAHVSEQENALPEARRRAIFATILEQMRDWQFTLD
jgi:chorismate mutase